MNRQVLNKAKAIQLRDFIGQFVIGKIFFSL